MNEYTKKRKRLFKIKQFFLLLTIISAIIFGFKSIINIGANVILNTNINALNKPFKILLMGGDSSEKRQTSPLIDSIIILTINPKNSRNNVDISTLSIPRDTRVTYVVDGQKTNKKGKINATFSVADGANDKKNGLESTKETVENLLNTKIDYYAYTDFEGLISIVDKIGGININVPYAFCEQDSKDQSNKICFTPGEQTLTGEQALAYARQRKAINPETGTSGDDWERNIRQQEVIGAIFKKIISNPTKYAIPVYAAIKDGAIYTNLSASILSKLANFAISLYNNITNMLSTQGTVNLLVKTSDYNHLVNIDSYKNLFNIDNVRGTKTLQDLYPDQNSIYSKKTFVNTISLIPENTKIPTISSENINNKIDIEISNATIGTNNDPSGQTSDQFIDEETLEYFQEFMKESN